MQLPTIEEIARWPVFFRIEPQFYRKMSITIRLLNDTAFPIEVLSFMNAT